MLHHPEVALLPGDGVEHGGHHEEPTEAEAVNPSRDGLPVVVGQEVEVGAAEDAGDDPESMGGTVGCMLVLGGLVPLVGRDSVVHEPFIVNAG